MNAPHAAHDHSPAQTRMPLRLHLGDEQPDLAALDGAWWPRSREMGRELGDLLDHFPPHFGRPHRALVSPADWDSPVRRIRVTEGHLEAGTVPGDDTHIVIVHTSLDHRVRLLVIPPGFSDYHAAEAMLAACTRGNTHSAGQLLEEVVDQPDHDPSQIWS